VPARRRDGGDHEHRGATADEQHRRAEPDDRAGVTPSIASITRLITRPSISVGVVRCTSVIMTTAT